jgi:acyl-CoA hydrolase
MPSQTNPHNTLFGGELLSWIDKAAFMTGQRHSGRAHVVTARIENVDFIRALKVGEQALITSQLLSVGNSSMRIRVMVEREDPFGGETLPVAVAEAIFVALDERAQPAQVPALAAETSDAPDEGTAKPTAAPNASVTPRGRPLRDRVLAPEGWIFRRGSYRYLLRSVGLT